MGSQGFGSDRRRQDAHSPAPTDLVERAQHGDEAARTELLARLEPFVKWAVGPFGSDGVPTEDLEQAGQVGVLEALKGFDPGQGAAFHTYAVPWIQGEARAVVRESGSIRLPPKKAALVGKVMGERERLESALGREPTPAEVADSLGSDTNEIELALEWAQLQRAAPLRPVRGRRGRRRDGHEPC